MLWLHHFPFATLNPISCLIQNLHWSGLPAFMGCKEQAVTAPETEASGQVCQSDSSHHLQPDSATTTSHQLTGPEVTLSSLSSFTMYKWDCFSPTSTTPFTLSIFKAVQRKRNKLIDSKAQQDKHKVWHLHAYSGYKEAKTFPHPRYVCTPWHMSCCPSCHRPPPRQWAVNISRNPGQIPALILVRRYKQ